MLVFMGRTAKKTEECVAIVSGKSLRLYEGPYNQLKKTTEHPTEEAAGAELEKLVARREKAGFRVHHRLEHSPWLDWVDGLERMWNRVVADARAQNIACDLGRTTFQRTSPSQRSAQLVDAAGSELAELPMVASSVRMGWGLGDANLAFRIRFEVSLQQRGSELRLWTRQDNGSGIAAHGLVVGDVIEHHTVDGDVERMKLAAFADWFPRHIRDDVWGFALAELAR
jgi:hypothetical protein